jgi:hypothetical protein
MKKWIIGLALLLFLFLVLLYIFIPSKLTVSTAGFMSCTPGAAVRILSDGPGWKKWWPASGTNEGTASGDSDSIYILGLTGFSVTANLNQAVQISIQDQGTILPSLATILAVPGDSCVVQWVTALQAGPNPLQRIRQYMHAGRIRNNMQTVLAALQVWLDKKENVYGLQLRSSSTVDTLLIAIRQDFAEYPATPEIYGLVATLRQYAEQQGAAVTDQPLLSVLPRQPAGFAVMVALPVNRQLEGRAPIVFSRMVPGRFIVSEVRGGTGRVQEALSQIQHYFEDYKKTSMAIRFQSLVTDRMKEPDSSKWVTRLYAPVF